MVEDILRPGRGSLPGRCCHSWRMYWRQILQQELPWRQCFYRTPWIFRKLQCLIRRRLEERREEYAFSVQTQSLYDAASRPAALRLPDHTRLANLSYPAFRREDLSRRTG